MAKVISHHDALIYAMVTMSAVDRTMTDAELARIGNIVNNLPVFDDFDANKLVQTAEDCGEILSADGGLDAVLELIAQSVPPKLYETAYALAVEVAAADLAVGQEELRLLEMIQDKLRIDALTKAGIERGARARHSVA